MIEMTKKHISFTADSSVWKFLKREAIERETTMKDLIIEAIKEKYDLTGTNPMKIVLHDTDPDITNPVKELHGDKIASDETIREITLHGIKYLVENKKATMKDFVKDVYPKFEGNHTKGSFKKVMRHGLEKYERLTDRIKVPHGRGHSTYQWVD